MSEESLCYQSLAPEALPSNITTILMTLINDMELSTSMYDKLYESVFRINYSAAVYKQLDRLVRIKENCCWIVVLTLLLIYYEGHGAITTISQRNMYERLSQS